MAIRYYDMKDFVKNIRIVDPYNDYNAHPTNDIFICQDTYIPEMYFLKEASAS